MMRPRTPDLEEAAQQRRRQRVRRLLANQHQCGLDEAHSSWQHQQVVLLHSDTSRSSTRSATSYECNVVDDVGDYHRREHDVAEDGVIDPDSPSPYPTGHEQRQFYPSTSTFPPKHVPTPQIQSDSKKTSSPRRYRTNPKIQRYIFEVTLLIHIFSLFACVASTHFASSHHSQPCKNFRFPTQHRRNVSDQCSVWSNSAIPELCSAGTQSRIRMLRHIFLFPELQPLSLFEIFSVGWKEGGKWHLQSGERGNDCISGSINRCTACFKKLSGTLRRLDEAYRSFDVTLSRFDCLPAIDTASATRPFSPNATCDNCKIWYRRWLLVQSLQIWKFAPCINWCYYTQLACPHLAPAKLWDYAGHPSFQCRDMDIDSWRQECDCIHPCDVRGIVSPGIIGNAPSIRHDFFAAQVHCETRKRECHAHSTAHDRKTIVGSSTPKPARLSSNSRRAAEWTIPRLFHYFLLLLLWML